MSNDKKATAKFPQRMVLPDGTVFTAYGVRTTKAPPPIKPLSACRVSPAPKPAPTTHKPAVPVDWSFWPASRRVKRDEAVALSLALDPHFLYSSINGHINPEYCPDNATAMLFLKRLNLLAASDSRTNILLSEFAAWAVSISLAPIPPEFEAIVNATKSKEVRARAVEKVGAGHTATEGDWKIKAKAIADRVGLEQYNNGSRQITARGICGVVAEELAKDETTRGLQGSRSSGNVRTHGLRHWIFTPPKDTK